MTLAPNLMTKRFLEEAGGHIFLDAGLQVIDVGPEYLRLTKAKRENVLNKHFFDTVTEPDIHRQAEVVTTIRASFNRALQKGSTEKLPPYRCDVLEEEGRYPEERWWAAAVVPLADEEGHLQYLVFRVEDITAQTVAQRGLDAQRKSNYILYGLVLAAMIVIGLTTAHNSSSVNTVNTHTCQVQGQYLKSTRPLTAVMIDINLLLQQPRLAGQPPVPKPEQVILSNLQSDLHAYILITSTLPPTRKC